MMERDNLICMLIGWYSAKNIYDDHMDIKIKVDNALSNAKFTPLGTEPNDLQLMDELLGETMMYVMGQGYNRKERRLGGVVKSK